MALVSFRVYGDPVPQPRPRVSTFAGIARAYVQKKHPIHNFREAVRLAAPLFPGRRCGDADNLAKGILDALHGVAFEDDDQADLGYVRRRYWHTSFVDIRIAEVAIGDYGE